jgi:hypothetical protein
MQRGAGCSHRPVRVMLTELRASPSCLGPGRGHSDDSRAESLIK